MIRPVNALGAVMGGYQARQQRDEMLAQKDFRNALAQYGMEAPQTRNAFAAVNPQAAMGFAMDERRMAQQADQFGQTMAFNREQFQAQQEIARANLALSRAASARANRAASKAERDEGLKSIAAMIGTNLSLPVDVQRMNYAQIYATAERMNYDLKGIPTPDQYTPEVGKNLFSALSQTVYEPPKPPDPWANYKVVGNNVMGMGPNGPQVVASAPAEPNAREQKIIDTMQTFNVDRATAVSLVDRHIEAATDAYGNPTTINLAQAAQAPTSTAGPPPFTPVSVVPVDPGVNTPDAFGQIDALGRLADMATDAILGIRVAPSSTAAAATVNAFNEGLLSEIAAAYGNRPSNWTMQRISKLIADPDAFLSGEGRALDQYLALDNEIRSEVEVLTQKLQAPIRPAERVETETTINRLNGVRSRIQGFANSLAAGGAAPNIPPPPQSFLDNADAKKVAEKNGLTVEELWRGGSDELRARFSQ